jgi:hypothetical protein
MAHLLGAPFYSEYLFLFIIIKRSLGVIIMKKLKFLLLTFLTFSVIPNLYAQDIQIINLEDFKYEPVGTNEIILNFEVVNISTVEQTVFEVRTINNVPSGWSSSLCFGELCFAPSVDSVATTSTFGTPPLAPGDTLETSLHVNTDLTSIATAYVQIEVGTFQNPNDRIILDFVATTDPTVDVEDEPSLNNYSLAQNYPNPFNPSTKINYAVGTEGFVNLKVYNILGVEVATLVNEYKPIGSYTAKFNASELASGVYIYKLSVNEFSQTRKMVLEK